jgi:hypothetical protein
MAEKLMTRSEMHEAIFLVLTAIRDDGPPLQNDAEKAHELANALFHALKGRGLLVKLDDDD